MDTMSGSPGAVTADRPHVSTEVLVGGGGPTGLCTALWLAQHGVDTVLVERRRSVGIYPRAHLLNVRTMELFDRLGVADEILDKGPQSDRWRGVAWYTTLAGGGVGRGKRIGYISAWGGGPDTERYATASPMRFSNLPQSQLDKLLLRHTQRALGDRVCLYHELVDLRQDDAGATATVVERAHGTRHEISARYVVLADGGRDSGTLLGVGMSGPRSLVEVVSVYAAMDLDGWADDDALLTYFINPDGETVHRGALLSLNPENKASDAREWLASTRFPMGDSRRLDEGLCLERIRSMLGVPGLEIEVRQISRWQYEGVVADRFRVGSCFLAGDAAHRHPPTGGLGLNTGVQDAWNLAWKLVAVLRHGAPDSLLDSYEKERLPVAAFNVAHSLRNAGRHAPIGHALGLRDGGDAEDGWQQIGVWQSDTPEGELRRRRVTEAVGANAEDYSQLNVEAGFSYESGCVAPDGTPRPDNHGSATDFVPSARPGRHLPHVWIGGGEGRHSTLDLVGTEAWTLIVDGAAVDAWWSAVGAGSDAAPIGMPIRVVPLAPDVPGSAEFRAIAEVGSGWALLVRPDFHVVWRCRELPEDPGAAVGDAVRVALRGHTAATHEDDLSTLIDEIDEAGGPLRVGDGDARAELFTVVGHDG